MRLHGLATPAYFHFQIIYRPQDVGCILRNVENGKGNLIGNFLLLPISYNYVTNLHLVSCGSETWFYILSHKKGTKF